MGLSIYEDLTEHDVAMQSIPLYCPEITEKMAEEYCCDNCCFKDPFDKNSGGFRYFGMIQVYITPEILVRLDREHLKKTEKENYGYLSIYNAFFKDLHILMSDFVSKRFKERGAAGLLSMAASLTGTFLLIRRRKQLGLGQK